MKWEMMPHVKYILMLHFVAVFSIFALASSCLAARNIALSKPYTVFPDHKYSLTAPSTDKTALTDGVYSPNGIMWTYNSTVGWQNTRTVRIRIDLENISVIESITFSTAKGNMGDVNYPRKIDAFLGPDEEHLLYMGNLAVGADNSPVKYDAERFSLKDIGAKGRYLLLEVELDGYYLFCDEIEVIEGELDKGKTGKLSIAEAPRLLVERSILQGLVEEVRLQCTGHTEFVSRLARIEQRIRTADASLDETRSIEVALRTLYGEILSVRFPGQIFLIESLPPWGKFSPVATPSGTPLENISLSPPLGGYDHSSFVITNISSIEQKVLLTFDTRVSLPPAVSFYQIPFVQSAVMEYVADPLVPVQESFSLRSGESKVIFVSSLGNMSGTWQNSLKVVIGSALVTIPVDIHVAHVALPTQLSLNSVTWNFLDFKPTQDRKDVAMRDLFAHHSLVGVISSVNLAITDSNVSDYIRMNQAFARLKGSSYVLLMMAFREDWVKTSRGKYEFMSDSWKAWFRTWYDRALQSASAAGFMQDQIFLYPYDEMAGKEIDEFISFATWARQEIPGIKLYATLGGKDSERALPYLDIAQVTNNDDVLKKFHSSNTELWIYDANGPAKSLSSYTYYRMMAWKAFLKGYKGIGFWAYSDTGWQPFPSSAWDDFDGKYPDFAVIYEGPDKTIISSRRWEAWRMGMEDYELLTMYAKAKGDNIAKALAKKVLDNPDDTSLADEVRHKILHELSTH